MIKYSLKRLKRIKMEDKQVGTGLIWLLNLINGKFLSIVHSNPAILHQLTNPPILNPKFLQLLSIDLARQLIRDTNKICY